MKRVAVLQEFCVCVFYCSGLEVMIYYYINIL